MERILRSAVVTGPTGAIGTALCQNLLDHGLTVYAVCRPSSPRAAALPVSDRLHKVDCDAADYASLPGKVGQADAFFHFAWAHTIGPGRNDMPAQIENIRYTIDAVRAADALGCQVFVGAGSQAEYGRVEGLLEPDTPANPENGYGMAKLCAGQMSRVEAASLGVDHVWARVLSVYGPHDGPATMISGTIRALLAGQCPPLTAGEQKWDYLYAADAAEAFYCMAHSGQNGAVYPLGSGQARPLKEYILALRDAIDPALPLGFGQVAYGPKQVMHLQADIGPLTRDTGFVPQTGFTEGIRKTIEWVRKENHG
nr:NAD(P)-dependent oxidoreductase [uncultured Gemmiger sp.]